MTVLLDTDHLSLYQMGHPQILQNVARQLTDRLAISVITVLWLGLLTKPPVLTEGFL